MNDLHHIPEPRPSASKLPLVEEWIDRALRAETAVRSLTAQLVAARRVARDAVTAGREIVQRLGAENLRLRSRLDQSEARRDDAEKMAQRVAEELRRLRARQGKG